MTDKIREVADGILAAMRHADPRPGDNRPDNRRPLGNGEQRQVGKRRNRHRRKTSEQVKMLRRLGWPARRITALSEEAATTIIAKGTLYELRTHERLLAHGFPSTKPQTERPQPREERRTGGAGGKKETLSVPLARPSGARRRDLPGLEVNPQNEGADDMNTYSHKSNARRAARAELGAQATERVDYRLVQCGEDGWGWSRRQLPPRKARSAGDKESRLKALLVRKGGATVEEICQDTGWLPHSARARISGLRKAGVKVERFKDVDGLGTAYRIAGAA